MKGLGLGGHSHRVYPRAGGGTAKFERSRFAKRRRVYPRAGGGTHLDTDQQTIPQELGLSPRRRGNLCKFAERRDRVRASRVYPRAGGGTRRRQAEPFRTCRGSIPAQAGEPDGLGGPPSRRCGSIPAQAGEPSCRTASSPVCRLGSIPAQAGEPYRPHPRTIVEPLHGSIPAQAGEPRPGRRSPMMRMRVYPRAGGGTAHRTFVHQQIPGGSGLSPRRRGNRPRGGRGPIARAGSIPAQAGEPESPRSSRHARPRSGSIPAQAGEPTWRTPTD